MSKNKKTIKHYKKRKNRYTRYKKYKGGLQTPSTSSSGNTAVSLSPTMLRSNISGSLQNPLSFVSSGANYEEAYEYVQDISEILCEHGIDLDKMLYNMNENAMKTGVHLETLLIKFAEDIAQLITFTTPPAPIVAFVFKKLYENGTFKCALRDKTQNVNLNSTSVAGRANKIKPLIEKTIKNIKPIIKMVTELVQ